MLLKDGIATVYARTDVSGPGEAPRYERAMRTKSLYAELSFETSPADPTKRRRELRTDARIRIKQCREIREEDEVELESFHQDTGAARYRVQRAYHGTDEENGDAISDLTLVEVKRT